MIRGRMLLNHHINHDFISENVPRRLLIIAGQPACAVRSVRQFASGQVNVKRNQLRRSQRCTSMQTQARLNSFDPDRRTGKLADVLSARGNRQGSFVTHCSGVALCRLGTDYLPQQYRTANGAWHWTENGRWSDAAHHSGYFTGSTNSRNRRATFLPMRLPTVVSRLVVDDPVPGPNLSYGRAIHT